MFVFRKISAELLSVDDIRKMLLASINLTPAFFNYVQRYFYFTDNLSKSTYRQVSNIRRNLVGNKIVDHSDVVGASPVGAAPTTSSFST